MATKYWVNGSGSWSQPVYASDTFTGTNGTALDGRSSTTGGGTWAKNGGIAADNFVQDGAGRVYHSVSGDGVAMLTGITLPTPDYTVSLDVYKADTSTNTEIGVVGRWDSATMNGILLQFSNNNINVFRCVGGTYTQLGSNYAYTPGAGTTFTLQLQMSGQTIKCVLNGTTVITVTDSTYALTVGGVGVRASEASGATTGTHGGNFKVESLNWSTSSGGPANTTAPAAGDAVIIDSGSDNSNNVFTVNVDVTPPSLASFAVGGSSISYYYEYDVAKFCTLNWTGNYPISVAGNLTIQGDVQFSGTVGQGGFILTATSTWTSFSASKIPYLAINAPGGTVSQSFGTPGGAGVWYSCNYSIGYLALLAGTLVMATADSSSGGHGLGYGNVTYVDTLALSDATTTRVLNMNTSSAENCIFYVTTKIDASNTTGLTISNSAYGIIYFNNANTFINDSLIGSSGLDLSNHTADDGSTWSSVHGGAGSMIFDSSGKYVYSTAAAGAVAYYQNSTYIPVMDYTVQADMYMPQAVGEGGIFGRGYGGSDSMYMFRYNAVSGQYELYKSVSGVYTSLATNNNALYLPSNGSTVTLQMVFVGNQITCNVIISGVSYQLMQVNDNSVAFPANGNGAGFRFNTAAGTDTTGLHMKNFKVYRNNTYTSPMTFNGGGLSWPAVYVQTGSINISGNNTFASLQASAGVQTTLTGTNTITTWNLGAGTAWILPSGLTQTVTLGTSPSGTAQANVYIKASTPGSQAILATSSNQTVSWWDVQDIKVNSPYQIMVYRGINLGDNTNIIFVTGQSKLYAYDVYNYQGTYIGQITDSIVDPEISQDINTPGGQLTIRRGVDPTNFGEYGLIDYKNKVVMRVFTDDYPNGYQYFQGFIADWTPNIEPDNQYVDVIVLPYGTEFSNFLMITDPSVDVQNGNDPSVYPAHQQSDSATYIAQKWTTGASVTNITGLQEIWFQVGSGFGDQNMYYKIVSDSGGAPNMSNVLYSGTLNQFLTFPAAITLASNTPYYLVVYGDPGYQVNSYACLTGTTANKLMVSSNGTSWSNESHNYTMAGFKTYYSSGNTQVAYNTNLQSIIEDVLNNYQFQGGTITYTAGVSIPNALANISVNYTFQTNTVLEGMNKCLDFCPAGWYWYVDQATNVVYFKPMATTPTHYLTLGKDILKYQLQRSMETVVNDLLVTGGLDSAGGGFNLYRRYYNLQSINRYGRRQATYNDSNLKVDATADIIGKSYINNTKNPTQRGSIDVFSYPTTKNNTGGYNIEVMRVGDVLFVQGTYNSVNLQISRIDYKGYFATIDVSDIPPQLNVQAQNIEDGLQSVQTANNPSSPTIIVVP